MGGGAVYSISFKKYFKFIIIQCVPMKNQLDTLKIKLLSMILVFLEVTSPPPDPLEENELLSFEISFEGADFMFEFF